jgi:hypothetical protein
MVAGGSGLGAGESQQLIGQLCGATGGVAKLVDLVDRDQQTATAPRGHDAPGRLGPGLYLGLQAGQRRSQLVRRVGDESALVLGLLGQERRKQAMEQPAPEGKEHFPHRRALR